MSRERAAAISPYFCTRGTIALILWIAHANRARFTWHDVDEYWAPTQYPEALQSAWALIREFSWRAPSDDELKAVTAPCLVMVGTADRVIAPNEAEDFARRMPNATFRSLRNEGHLFVESSAEVTNQEILRLLAR
jgi:pimeloyl-ACP methyl ester carboxylesterase